MSRLLEKYKSEVVKALTEKFAYKNVMQVPKLEKIVINMAVGDAVGNSKALESAMADFPDGERLVTAEELAKLNDREMATLISRNESDSCTKEERRYYRKGAKSALQLFLSEERAEEIMTEFDKMYSELEK